MIIGIDTETYKRGEDGIYRPSLNAKDFVLGCMIIDRLKKPLFFYNPEEMYNHILLLSERAKKEGHKLYIYGHSSGYDYASIFGEHLKEVDKLKILTQKPFFGIFNENVYLLDTLSFIRNESKKSLGELGELLGIPKMEMPSEILEPKDLRAYCLNDTRIVFEYIKGLPNKIKDSGLKRPKRILTAGSLAMSCFKSFVRDPLNCNYNGLPYSSYLYKRGTIHQTRFHSFIKKAQRGARVECFRNGKLNNIGVIDVRSLYPSMMANKVFPDPLSEMFIENPEQLFSQEELLVQMGVIEATLIRPKCKIGYLPIRKEGKGIYFPFSENEIGELRGFWTTLEVNSAIKEGYKLTKIHNGVFYRPLPFNPFKEFINKLYSMRMKSDKMQNQVIKLLMNSLGLKFSQYRGEKLREICHRSECQKWLELGYEIETDYGEQYMMVKEGEAKLPKFANPIFSIYILAYARDFLYKEIKKIPFEDLIYCDTDSIFMLNFEKHKKKFKIGEELGDFKIEFEGVNGEFIREKVYSIEDNEGERLKIVLAGSTNRELSQEQLSGKESYQIRNMYSFNMGYRTGNFEKVGTFYTIEKKIKPEFRKRLVKFPTSYREYTKEDLITS